MRRTHGLLAVFVIFTFSFVVALTGCSWWDSETPDRNAQNPARPNIILIITDDMRADDLKHMPTTQELIADKGLAFKNALVTTPICCPSRATILTGRYAHNHNILRNDPERGGFASFYRSGAEDETLATWLNKAGYKTMLAGRYLNGYCVEPATCPTEKTYVPPGWDRWYVQLGGAELNANGKLEVMDRDLHRDDLVRKQALTFLENTKRTPFFATLWTRAPHGAWDHSGNLSSRMFADRHEGMFVGKEAPRPPSFDESDLSDKPEYRRNLPTIDPEGEDEIDRLYRARLRSLQAVDEMVGALVRDLRKSGEMKNTYLIFTSDNGFHLGEHRLLAGKGKLYEEDIRVPLVIRGPGVRVGKRDQLVLNADLAPTIADLAGIEPGAPVDGRSMQPLFEDDPQVSWRGAALVETWPNEAVPNSPGPHQGIRTGRYIYIEYPRTGEEELYDLADDPYQMNSIHTSSSATPAGLKEDLARRLDVLRECAGEVCRRAEN